MRELGLSDSYSLYPLSAVQPLKPHQVADLDRAVRFARRHISFVLNLEVGLGKPKVFLALLVVMVVMISRMRRETRPLWAGARALNSIDLLCF